MKINIPAVSIIIPMYNAEKYIGECLDSILAQTFDDFEVIVVDDASTDKSRDIAGSYSSKFNRETEKLKLIRSNKNSGGCSFPRNIGMQFARGEYLMFVDSDDAVTKNAVEKLYTVAKNFDADVVNCDRYFALRDTENSLTLDKSSLRPATYLSACKFVTEPTLLDGDIEKRISDFKNRQILWNAWGKLIRRKLISDTDLKMVGTGAEDMVFTTCLLCTAKNYVRVPDIIYFYRKSDVSITRRKIDAAETIGKWLKMLANGINYIENFFGKNEIALNATQAKYFFYNAFAYEIMRYIIPIYKKIPDWQLDEVIRRVLDSVHDKTALTTFLFSRMSILNWQLIKAQEKINQLQQQLE